MHRRALRPVLTAAAVLALLAAPAASAQPDGSVALRDGVAQAPSAALQRAFAAQPAWQRFRADHGDWTALWNEATGTPHRAFGPAAAIPGVGRLSAGNVGAAAELFVQRNADVFGTAPDRLRRVGAVQADRRWYVSYVQTYGGLDVLRSEVELRLFENGRVMAFGATTYGDVEVSTTPALSAEAARRAATAGLAFDPATDRATTEGRLAVLPLKAADEARRFDYHLVYEVRVETAAPLGRYLTYVDAHTGDVLWRHNFVVAHDYGRRHRPALERTTLGAPLAEAAPRYPFTPGASPSSSAAEFTGEVDGLIQPYSPFDAFESRSFEDLTVTIGGVTAVTTDAAGAFTFDATAPVLITAELAGPFLNANNVADEDEDGEEDPDARAELTFDPATDAAPTISWNDDNSHPAERMVFYHGNLIHSFNKDLDDAFVGMDYPVPANVNVDDSCNAFWDGTSINFFEEGGGCPNIGQIPSVIYHEYGHGVNQTQYDQADDGVVNGSTALFNRAINEALADVQSILIEDLPVIGAGFGGEGTVLRDMRDDFRYPDTYTGGLPPDDLNGAYDDSQILSGAFWDARVAIGGEAGIEALRRIAHFARYGRPDDPQTTFVALGEFFLEALIADDNDGDLANGTPNFEALVGAFTGRGIGLNLYVPSTFEHEPLEDTPNVEEPYLVAFEVDPIVGGAEVVRVHYSTDNFLTVESVQPTEVAPNQFEALLPAQARGSLVRYYITVDYFTSTEPLTLPGDPFETAYAFAVGVDEVLFDAFEEESGWTVGAPDDDATRGLWERGDPESTENGGQTVQPPRDHTPNLGNTDAWVTGVEAGSTASSEDVDGGKTTLLSPVFDMTPYGDPIVRYWKYYTNDRGTNPGEDVWRVDVSADGGTTWVPVEATTRSTNAWEAVVLRVADYVDPGAQVQFRFVAEDASPFSLVEALLDDFQILSNPEAVAAEDDALGAPASFALRGNFPNPFADRTELVFDLPERADVTLVVYDVMGRAVRTVADRPFAAGTHTVALEAAGLAGGTYVARLVAGDAAATHKLVLLK